VDNNQRLLKLNIDKEINPSQLLTSETKIAFVMPGISMDAYYHFFYPFFSFM
jgi:hypothetical protein